jgi:putative ABC transport system substrate-binding protein
MKRREFIAYLGGAAISLGAASAQQPIKMRRIAIVSTATKVADMNASHPEWGPFFEELSRNGFVEGQNILVERYSGEGRTEHYADLARDVVGRHPELIFAAGGTLALVFKAATTTIPIVTITADPIALGLASSLARPDGNITGASSDAGLEFYGKVLGLLAETVPKLSRVGYLVSQRQWEMSTGSAAAVRTAARHAGISLTSTLLGTTFNEAAYRQAFDSLEQDRVDGLMVSSEAEHFAYRVTLVELVAKSRIPAIYPFRELVDTGGLMSYSPDLPDLFRTLATPVAKILNGAKPQDIPFQQPTRFELVINLKTAKALGFELPASLVARAKRDLRPRCRRSN